MLHRALAPPPGPWVSVGDCWLHPGLVQRNASGDWQDHSDLLYLIKPALYRAGFLQRTTGSVPEEKTDAEGLKLSC